MLQCVNSMVELWKESKEGHNEGTVLTKLFSSSDTQEKYKYIKNHSTTKPPLVNERFPKKWKQVLAAIKTACRSQLDE